MAKRPCFTQVATYVPFPLRRRPADPDSIRARPMTTEKCILKWSAVAVGCPSGRTIYPATWGAYYLKRESPLRCVLFLR